MIFILDTFNLKQRRLYRSTYLRKMVLRNILCVSWQKILTRISSRAKFIHLVYELDVSLWTWCSCLKSTKSSKLRSATSVSHHADARALRPRLPAYSSTIGLLKPATCIKEARNLEWNPFCTEYFRDIEGKSKRTRGPLTIYRCVHVRARFSVCEYPIEGRNRFRNIN